MPTLTDEQVHALAVLAAALAANLVAGLALVTIGWFASKYARKVVMAGAHRADLHDSMARFLGSAAQYAVILVAALGALDRVGVQTASVVAALASAGVAVGLALQGTLSHLASGVMLVVFRPFDLGDIVKVGGETGRVTDVGLFATRLVTVDGVKVSVPNGAITSATIVNYTGLGRRAGTVILGFDHAVPVEEARAALLAVAQEAEGVLTDPAAAVAIIGIGATGYELELRAWSDARTFGETLDRVRAAAVTVARQYPRAAAAPAPAPPPAR